MIDQETLKQFDLLYENTYFDVSQYVVCKCSKPDDVEDILQNIYLSVFKAIISKSDITKTYIMGIAKHKINDYYRFKYKEKIISFENLYEMKGNIIIKLWQLWQQYFRENMKWNLQYTNKAGKIAQLFLFYFFN